MNNVDTLLDRSRVHQDWREILRDALLTLDQKYVESLLWDDSWLPGIDNLLAAFRRNRSGLRYLLIGESPYPRRESANGIAFFDAAVNELWSDKGLSKSVNRATSLRNIIKTTLSAEGYLLKGSDGKITQDSIARLDKQDLIQTLAEWFVNLERSGFLMLNATPVLHPQRKPPVEARYWESFLEQLLSLIAQTSNQPVTLLLWGKIAQQIETIPAAIAFNRLVCEHPYNISFIDNPEMLQLFANLDSLKRPNSTQNF